LTQLEIRSARPTDVTDTIPLIYSSGPHEFEYGFTHAGRSAKGFLEYAFQTEKGLISYRNHISVCRGDEVVGVGAFYTDKDYAMRSNQIALQLVRYYPLLSLLSVVRHALHLQSIIPAIPSDTFYIADLGVKEAWRGKGIGKMLLDYGKQQAKRMNFSSCMLDVSIANPRAQALYEREGFVVINEFAFKGVPGMVSDSSRMRFSLSA
jgi:ribosomal protein S18 acetylase RimI-like enzyme